MSRSLGAIYTPEDITQFLVSWAIKSPTSKVLDVGIGEGVFSFAAYNQLIKLGASSAEAQAQIYGSEIDPSAYERFLATAKNANVSFSHLHNEDFFDREFPPVDAVVGNPPYVRRTYIENVDHIRQKVIEKNLSSKQGSWTRLTDLYIYFLLYASAVLKPEGRLSVITPDSWLNVGYGKGFKEYLQQQFEIKSLISVDRPIFHDAQVKAVMILAIKQNLQQNRSIHFIRLKNGLPIGTVQKILEEPDLKNTDVASSKVALQELKANTFWGIYFKMPETINKISSHPLMAPISDVAETRIGIQTLAKDFFVLTPEQVKALQIENEYLEPLAQSCKYFKAPVITCETSPLFYVFSCAKSKEELQGTHALSYILRGEQVEVPVRGKGKTVIGYQNKERIQSDRRKFWYDLKTSIERRGRASILVPRLVYRNFTVIWNKANFVPGELFIEFLPHLDTDLEVYLAILNSSVSEILLRAHAQVYGGGTYNIEPGVIKQVPIINGELLTKQQRAQLKKVYSQYLEDQHHDRSMIDKVIYRILDFDLAMQQKLKEVLADLLVIATSSKKRKSSHP